MAIRRPREGSGTLGSNDEIQWGVGNVMKRAVELGSQIQRDSAVSDKFGSVQEKFLT